MDVMVRHGRPDRAEQLVTVGQGEAHAERPPAIGAQARIDQELDAVGGDPHELPQLARRANVLARELDEDRERPVRPIISPDLPSRLRCAVHTGTAAGDGGPAPAGNVGDLDGHPPARAQGDRSALAADARGARKREPARASQRGQLAHPAEGQLLVGLRGAVQADLDESILGPLERSRTRGTMVADVGPGDARQRERCGKEHGEAIVLAGRERVSELAHPHRRPVEDVDVVCGCGGERAVGRASAGCGRPAKRQVPPRPQRHRPDAPLLSFSADGGALGARGFEHKVLIGKVDRHHGCGQRGKLELQAAHSPEVPGRGDRGDAELTLGASAEHQDLTLGPHAKLRGCPVEGGLDDGRPAHRYREGRRALPERPDLRGQDDVHPRIPFGGGRGDDGLVSHVGERHARGRLRGIHLIVRVRQVPQADELGVRDEHLAGLIGLGRVALVGDDQRGGGRTALRGLRLRGALCGVRRGRQGADGEQEGGRGGGGPLALSVDGALPPAADRNQQVEGDEGCGGDERSVGEVCRPGPPRRQEARCGENPSGEDRLHRSAAPHKGEADHRHEDKSEPPPPAHRGVAGDAHNGLRLAQRRERHRRSAVGRGDERHGKRVSPLHHRPLPESDDLLGGGLRRGLRYWLCRRRLWLKIRCGKTQTILYPPIRRPPPLVASARRPSRHLLLESRLRFHLSPRHLRVLRLLPAPRTPGPHLDAGEIIIRCIHESLTGRDRTRRHPVRVPLPAQRAEEGREVIAYSFVGRYRAMDADGLEVGLLRGDRVTGRGDDFPLQAVDLNPDGRRGRQFGAGDSLRRRAHRVHNADGNGFVGSREGDEVVARRVALGLGLGAGDAQRPELGSVGKADGEELKAGVDDMEGGVAALRPVGTQECRQARRADQGGGDRVSLVDLGAQRDRRPRTGRRRRRLDAVGRKHTRRLDRQRR